MNNFTKSSGRAYWHSITNLFCCSPHIKRLQDKSMKAVMLFMFFALGSGAMFAQNPNLGGGFLAGTIDGCMADVPAATPVADLMTDPFFDACRASTEAFLLEPIAVINGVDGEWGVASGFTKGSTNCSWTYYYVYTLKCAGEIEPYTVQYNGGDATQPKLKKGAVIPPGAKDLNLCYADIPAPHSVDYIANLYKDNCSHVKAGDLVTFRTKSKQDDCKWIVIYSYTVWDGCTEPIDISITYTGGDTQDPWFTSDLPAKKIFVDCDNIPAPQKLYWDDNCANGGKVVSVDDTSKLDDRGCAGGVILRTWSIVDNCGNSNSYTQTIEVSEAPQAYFDYTQDIYVPCADKANVASYIPDLWYSNGRSSKYCGISGYAKPNYTPIAESCGSFIVTYEFIDDCGRISNASLTVNIVDEINPSILLAADDMTVECDGDGNVEQYAAWLANNGGATAEDNCDTDLTWTNDDASHPFSDDCGATGQKTIVFTVSDDCGNESKTFATFYIVDTTDPYGKPAQDLRVQCDGEGNTNQYEVWLANHGGATATDDCSGVTWSHDGPVLKHYVDYYGKDVWENLTDYPNDFTGGCSTFTGSVTVTFRATDDCGNYTESTAVFSIEDSIAPVITPASDMTVECDGSIGGDAYGTNNQAQFDNWLYTNGGAVASPDACSNITWRYDYYKYGNACDTYYYTTFTASDECGNTTSTTASFHVVDTNSPAIGQEAQDMIVECNGGFDETIDEASAQGGSNMYQFYYWLANNGGATALDLCDDYLDWSNDYDGKSFTDECGYTGRITVLFTVTDDCGLSSTTSAEFVIVDTTVPTFTAPQDTTIYKDATCTYNADPYYTGDVYNESDNCNVYPLQATYSDKLSDYYCPGTSLITRTWSLMDECGNKADDQVQYIYIYDNTAPVLTGTLPPEMSNLDLCEAPVGPSEADVAAAYTDNCSNVVVVKTTNTVQVGECGWATQFSYTIADECGNALDPIKILYWGSDQSAPELALGNVLPKDDYSFTSCPEEALNGAGAGATVDEVFKLFTDNCDTKVDVYKDGPFYTKQGCDWAYYFTFTIYDNCDNSYSFNQNFSGSDKTAPQLVGVIPDDVSGINECKYEALNGTAAGPTTGEIAALYEECSGYGAVYVDKATHSFGTDCNWIISHEYTIYDYCGNFATPVKITYSGGDEDAPQFEVTASDKTVELDCDTTANGDAFNAWVAANGGAYAYDDCSDVITWTHTTVEGGTACARTSTVTFKASDACGNFVTTTAVFTVQDTTGPTIDPLTPIAVECQVDVPANDVGIVKATDCSNPVVITFVSDVTDGRFPVETITRTYRATDACGNATDVTQTITVEDTTAPEITCSGDISVNASNSGSVFVGSFDTHAGPNWQTNPDVYTGQEAAALLFGGVPSDYVLSTDSNPANITNTNWASTWGSPCLVVANNYKVDQGAPGYNDPGGTGTAVSAYVNDWCFDGGHINYVYTVGNIVTYDAPIFSDNCDPNPTLELTAGLPSGSDFPIGDTTVTYLVTDASGNTATCSFIVTVVDTAPVGVADSGDVTLDFRAYPVPFNKDVNILYNFKFDTDVAIEVYDTKGLLVLRKDVKGYRSGSDMTLPLSIIGSDQLYYVKLITNRGTVIKKIVSSNVNKR